MRASLPWPNRNAYRGIIPMMDSEPTKRRRRPGRGPRSVRVLRRARRRARFRDSLTELGPKSRQIMLSDGRALGFDDFGDPDGTPVLFFHGFGSSRVVRHPDDEIATELGARVIAVDRPGIGISARQPNRRVTDYPHDIAELLDILGIERCAVVAWSGGGPYALACAWQMPERFSVVGLISAPAPLSGVPGSSGYTWRRHRAMSRTADHAPWVIALAMWQWSRQQKSDPHKQLDEAISGIRRGAVPGAPLRVPHRWRHGAGSYLARRPGQGGASGHGQVHRTHGARRGRDVLPARGPSLRLRALA